MTVISKQKVCQKYIYKLHSETLEKYKWDYILPLSEAMRHKKDVISLADSQILRFIERLNKSHTDSLARVIKKEIKQLKAIPVTEETKESIKEKYNQLYHVQFQSDYMCMIMDKKSHYDRANKGFKINNIPYRHFLGTSGGIKNSTIVYVSERLYPALEEILNCGRDRNKELIPQKLEAYQALICSASTPLSMPKGIIIVPDCYTTFKDDVIYIDDSEGDEPSVTFKENVDFEIDATDGFGLMLPSAAARWYEELNGTEGVLSGMNVRGLPWTKGMLYPFDFIKFAEEKNGGGYIIKDAWGDDRDVREAEVILTTSMLKLWDSYKNWEDYWFNVIKYGYQFAVAKTAPDVTDNERATNYQFLQSYYMDDEDIEELISPTLNKIRDALGNDYAKTLLFLCGQHLNEKNVFSNREPYIKALMCEPALMNDPYVRNKLYRMIKKKINDAKIGVIDVQANYSIIGGDPYSLCQSMFGHEVTGLLKAGECYHKYWSDRNVEEIVCFRAPMTSMNNIRKMRPVATEEMKYWYEYIKTCMLLNSWDSTAEAENGCDFDGDLFYTTNNPVLLRKHRKLPVIQCVQRKGVKVVPTEAAIVKANKNSFGDEIGSTTNIITSQICLQALFEPDSKEYKELDKRILTGQLLQQNAIDKAKGIVAKPMPKHWKDIRGYNKPDKDFMERIAANKKPYFFIYRYPTLKKDYLTYVKDNNINSELRFGKSLHTLLSSAFEELSQEEKDFITIYNRFIPVQDSPCVMNEICHKVEAFDNFKFSQTDFDYSILKTEAEYTAAEYEEIKQIYSVYCRQVNETMKVMHNKTLTDDYKKQIAFIELKKTFKDDCECVCPNPSKLLNIILDMCYKSKNDKDFVWIVCGEEIVTHLLKRNEGRITYPVSDEEGNIVFNGNRFSLVEMTIREEDEAE